ncbi:heme-binding protein [Aureimonas altamirensis]|uniref:GlcG/HbpS family heme-binding protein n=1 Tax=Aureimonas altamirensis TaxID=370622 RepID=UPI001E44292E|nr:heme-binding protein [Aureimonas altamirensis]UHD46043.1 heme-binding protein [Aureimonas altamirensis]
MNIATAESLIAFARAEAARDGFAVAIWVLDTAAYPVAFARLDGANLGPIDVSRKKARTAALFQTDSLQLGQAAQPGGAIYTLENTNGGLISFGGGVVLRDKAGTVIGAIGVAGATVEADEAIAQAAAASLLA